MLICIVEVKRDPRSHCSSFQFRRPSRQTTIPPQFVTLYTQGSAFSSLSHMTLISSPLPVRCLMLLRTKTFKDLVNIVPSTGERLNCSRLCGSFIDSPLWGSEALYDRKNTFIRVGSTRQFNTCRTTRAAEDSSRFFYGAWRVIWMFPGHTRWSRAHEHFHT